MSSQVSVVIPNWNQGDLLERLLVRLLAQSCPIDPIIVVDNASRDNSVELARRRGAQVIALDHNAGFSAAVNRGLAECRTPWVAVVNNDVEPAPDWLERLLTAAENSGTWFATGKLLETAQPGRIDGTYDALCRGGCAWRVGHGRPDGPLWDGSRKITFAPFTAALFRAELFRRVGPLDERFESYLEDLDFGLRCALQGFEGLYVPQAVAYHQGSATLGAWHKDTIRRISRNQVLLVAKHFPLAQLWRSGWAILVAQTLWGAVALRHGRGGAFLRGKLEGLRMFRQVRRGAAWRAAEAGRLSSVLDQSESEILEAQRQSGFDRYWRWYFALT